jgi:uncharacterized protein (TIGR02145 family)
MKKSFSYLFALSFITAIAVISSCKKDALIPDLKTVTVSEITTVSAVSGGQVISEGTSDITVRGVCWGTTTNPEVTGSHTTDGNGAGTFSSNLTGLATGTTYYVRAYATNSEGTAYGDELSFETVALVAATVTTAEILSITGKSAISGGNITSDGGDPVTERGICWSETLNPTTADNKTSDDSGSGLFSSELTGLAPGTTYHVRAYAVNSIGTAYGNDVTFTTLAVVPSVTTSAVAALSQTTAEAGGNVTATGGADVTSRGVCWGINPDPDVEGNYTTDGSGEGTFNSQLTDLVPNTLYYVRAYAVNSAGTSYGEQVEYYHGSITDIDGNEYPVVRIGTQIWMAENLKTTRFNDGSAIENVTGNYDWADKTSPAYSWYDNDMENYGSKYGALYNWYASNTESLCPSGWHVPSDDEFKTLEKYLGLTEEQADDLGARGTDQGTQLKSKSGWLDNGNGTNTSGFSALPGGVRNHMTGDFMNEGFVTGFWCTTNNQEEIFSRYLTGDMTQAGRNFGDQEKFKSAGNYIRCIKD